MHKTSEKKKERDSSKRNQVHGRTKGLLVLLLAAAIIVLLFIGGNWLEDKLREPEMRGDHTMRYAYDDLVEYNGDTYRRRKNVTTILLMGIDRPSSAVVQGYRNGGQADFLRLVVIDNDRKTVNQIAIDRDTMTPITVLGVLGNKSGVRTAQISLSHGFGNGGKQSCEFTVDAVSNLLCGIPVDFYIAMNLDGILAVNDMLGGVTVTLEDDFSAIDPSMTLGRTMTLVGDQAETYVRSRMNIGIGTNEARMKRQEEYISQLAALLDERIKKDKEYIGAMYDELEPYLITNASRGRLINEAWTAKDYEHAPLVQPAGTHEVASDGFMQFHVDEAALKQSVMELFYEIID